MLNNFDNIKYLDNVNVINVHDDELKYIIKLKYGYLFKLTNTNVVVTYTLNDLNKVFAHGIIRGR